MVGQSRIVVLSSSLEKILFRNRARIIDCEFDPVSSEIEFVVVGEDVPNTERVKVEFGEPEVRFKIVDT